LKEVNPEENYPETPMLYSMVMTVTTNDINEYKPGIINKIDNNIIVE